MNNPFQQHTCLQCSKTLAGRLDKKFCDDYCRNTYNNQNKRADQQYIQEVNKIIRKNRRILKSLCPIGKATVRKDVLDSLGFDYRYHSEIFKHKKGTYYLCYDYAFMPVNEYNTFTNETVQKALIVQKQSYFNDYEPDLWN